MATAHGDARERFNAIRNNEQADDVARGQVAEQPTPGPQTAGPEGAPSMIVGTPGWQEWLERNGMNPAFDEDDAWTRRVRGY